MRVKNKRLSDLAELLHKKGRKTLPIELLSRSSKPFTGGRTLRPNLLILPRQRS